jgi:hypothetical protein
MPANSHSPSKFMNDLPILLRLVIAASLLVLLAFIAMSVWSGSWLFGSFYLALLGSQIWIVAAVLRGASPSGWRAAGLGALSTLVLCLGIVILMRRFVS